MNSSFEQENLRFSTIQNIFWSIDWSFETRMLLVVRSFWITLLLKLGPLFSRDGMWRGGKMNWRNRLERFFFEIWNRFMITNSSLKLWKLQISCSDHLTCWDRRDLHWGKMCGVLKTPPVEVPWVSKKSLTSKIFFRLLRLPHLNHPKSQPKTIPNKIKEKFNFKRKLLFNRSNFLFSGENYNMICLFFFLQYLKLTNDFLPFRNLKNLLFDNIS